MKQPWGAVFKLCTTLTKAYGDVKKAEGIYRICDRYDAPSAFLINFPNIAIENVLAILAQYYKQIRGY